MFSQGFAVLAIEFLQMGLTSFYKSYILQTPIFCLVPNILRNLYIVPGSSHLPR